MSVLRGVIVLLIVLTLASCVSTKLSPIGSEKPFQAEEDEKQVWRDSERLERVFEKSGLLYKNQELEDYLNALAEKLVGQQVLDTGIKLRVKVVQSPFLNAFALPNGMIYVHTGMLARMENEAQLATVLGHELTHFTHRHTVKEMRVLKNRVAFANVLHILLAGAGGGLEELTGRTGELWALASVRGYSRELETEADEEGLKAMIRAGYDPNEAPKVFQHLQQELDENKVKEPFFLGTHPMLQDRIDNYRRLISTEYAEQAKETGRLINSEEFLRRTEPLLLDNAVLDLRIGRAGTARAAIEKYLKRKPDSARAYFLMGEVNRHGLDDLRAIAAYQEAARLDPTYAEPHRELGLMYRAQGRAKDARKEFKKYLSLNPGAADAPIIKGYFIESGEP